MSTTADLQNGRKPMLNSVWQTEVDRVTRDEWSAMIGLFDDANLYQTWSYGAVRWGGKSLSHLVLKRDGEVSALAQVRIVRPTPFNFGMAYLRWGPICHRRGRDLDVDVVSRMARALHDEYVVKRGLLLQILPNAFVGSPRAEIFKSAFSSYGQQRETNLQPYRTFVVDLSVSLQQLRKNLDPKWRNKLSGAERNGLTIVSGRGIEEYKSFSRLYTEMRNRKAFETTLDIEEFGKLQEDLLESERMEILICQRDGIAIAGVVASVIGNSAIYLLGATSDSGLDAKGSYLLQWTLIQRLYDAGVRWYDLGGIDPEGNPGVYQFKKGLSGTDVSHLQVFVACNSLLSSVVVKAGVTIDQALRSRHRIVQLHKYLSRSADEKSK
jgi:lipid II:glycine glycyltransferase (peptidoglycan interpeptide bridge formation enzyme)